MSSNFIYIEGRLMSQKLASDVDVSEFQRTKCLYWYPYSKGRGNLKMPLPSGEKNWPHCWWVTIFFFSLFHVFLRRKSSFRIHSNISQILFRNTALVHWMSFTIFLNYSICLYNHNECLPLFFKEINELA